MTGARRAEALALSWADIEWEQPRLYIRRGLARVGSELQISSPKSGQSRGVDLDEATASALRSHRAAQLEERLARGGEYTDLDLIFTRADGAPLDPSFVSKTFRARAKAAGLPPTTLHGLRHSHVTHLLLAGVPVHVVAARVGHKDPGFTLRRYAHLLPGSQREAVEKLREVVFG